jgi:hypothetical protein
MDDEDPHGTAQYARHRPNGVSVVARVESEPARGEQRLRLVRLIDQALEGCRSEQGTA